MMERPIVEPRLADKAATAKGVRWLRTLDGDAPVLLIAPHGGAAGPATRAAVNPKVNDLYTADITRELARRLGAGAIINAGMDRNRLDLNRLSQVMSEAPWMLELIATRLERIAARSGRAVVLLIHGWNVIEPRVDLGIGVKSAGGKLLPACAAHVSASDGFINGPVLDFVEALGRSGIKPTFGLRYPGAGANNLLQAFTQRHAASRIAVLRRLADLHACGALESVQLELSVALRLPGRLRTETIAAISESFARCARPAVAPSADSVERAGLIEIIRTEAPTSAPGHGVKGSPNAPLRVGLEFYDASMRVGAMASFDLGPGAAGARVMAIVGRERIALFTAEGRVERTPHSLKLGPLALRVDLNGGLPCFDFAGPAVVVEDGAAYLSVEHALSKAALHEAMELHAEFEVWPANDARAHSKSETLVELITRPENAGAGVFGRVTGHFRLAGHRHRIDAVARVGRSLIAIGNGAFSARKIIWAAFPAGDGPAAAVEARTLIGAGENADAHVLDRGARILDRGAWIENDLQRLRVTPAAFPRPPRRISAILQPPGNGEALSVNGEVQSFVMLSRPGLAQSRILTSLGFADFRLGDRRGAGMFEYSERSVPKASAPAETDKDDS
jgi:hypothetical protein